MVWRAAPQRGLCSRRCRYRLGNAFHELSLDLHAAACYRRCLALNRNDLRYWNDLGSACDVCAAAMGLNLRALF